MVATAEALSTTATAGNIVKQCKAEVPKAKGRWMKIQKCIDGKLEEQAASIKKGLNGLVGEAKRKATRSFINKECNVSCRKSEGYGRKFKVERKACVNQCGQKMWQDTHVSKSWGKSVAIVPTESVNQQSTETYIKCEGTLNRMIDESKMNFKHSDFSEANKFSDMSFTGNHTIWWDNVWLSPYYKTWTDAQKQKNIQFKRISDIDSAPSLWGSKDLSVLGTNQGSLPDDWWLTAASSLAEHEERIKAVFTEKQFSKDGLFHVKFWSMGQQYTVVIDDKLPVVNDLPAYARKSPNGAWWAPLLEKATAKFMSGYQRMSYTTYDSHLVFNMLTGMPMTKLRYCYVSWRTQGGIWGYLKKFDQMNYPMTVEVKRNADGLNNMLTAVVVGLAEIPSGNNKGVQLVKLRSPSTSERYTGPWNDDSQEMQDNAQILGHTPNSGDGSFYVPASYFRYFRNLNVLHYRDWKRDTKKVTIQADGGVAGLTVNNPVDQIASFAIARQVMARRCSSSYVSSLHCFAKDSNGEDIVKQNYDGVGYARAGSTLWMNFDNLKAGKYTLGRPGHNAKDMGKEIAFITMGDQQIIPFE